VGAFGKCLDEFNKDTATVDLWQCVPGALNEAWSLSASGELVNAFSGKCLTAVQLPPAASCSNVWARPLSNGDVGLAFVNNGDSAANVSCSTQCFEAANVTVAAKGLRVRDLVAHADLGVLLPPYSWTQLVAGGGDGAALRLTPVV
jgi:hypothetical protein